MKSSRADDLAKAKRKALMRVVLFVCRLQRAASIKVARKSTKRISLQKSLSSPKFSFEVSFHDESSGGTCMEPSSPIPRCSTADTLDLERHYRGSKPRNSPRSFSKSARNMNTLQDEDPRNSMFGSHLSLPILARSRSSSAASAHSVCSSTSDHRVPSNSSRGDSPCSLPLTDKVRLLDFTGMIKPYVLSFNNQDASASSKENSGKNFKSITVIHKSLSKSRVSGGNISVGGGALGEGKRQDTPQQKLIRRTSARERPVNGTGDGGGAADKGSRMRLARLLSKDHTTSTKYRSLNKSTSDEALGDNANANKKRHEMKRKNSADLLESISFEAASDGTSTSKAMTKAEKKQLEKLQSGKTHLASLFASVEQDVIGDVRSLLEHSDQEVNTENGDGFSLLDVATMLGHNEVALLLLKHGAQQNAKFPTVESRIKVIQKLVDACQRKLGELRVSARRNGMPPTKDLDQRIASQESRLHVLKKMRLYTEQAAVPLPPENVCLTVTGDTSLTVHFDPADQTKIVATQYKVEWASDAEFSVVEKIVVIKDLRRTDVTLAELRSNTTYFVRIFAGNLAGFSQPVNTQPPCATPSSWREAMEGGKNQDQCSVTQRQMNELYHEVMQFSQCESWRKFISGTGLVPKRKKSSLRNLFLSSKFQKTLKRGAVYLATILYCEDKIAVTVEDMLPVLEVEAEAPPTLLTADLNWLLKVSCSWEDIRMLSLESDASHSSPTLHFRLKLLDACGAMQTALGVQDLGRLHHQPITDCKGCTVFVTVQHLPDLKLVQGLAVRWISMSKFLRKQLPIPATEPSAIESLSGQLLDILNFFECTYIPLDRGLYLGYVKLRSTVTQISLLVPENLPSVLPFVYIRENQHVSREEWEWFWKLENGGEIDTQPTSSQLEFHQSLVSAAKILMDDLDIPNNEASSQRIFRFKVVEVHPDVSFILLLPPQGDVCAVPGQSSSFIQERQHGCLSLPVHAFEMAHLCTYRPEFIFLYSQLSSMLDLYTMTAQQILRQALKQAESDIARQYLEKMNIFQQRLEEIWRAIRWVSEVVTIARDKQQTDCGIPLELLYNYPSPQGIGRSISDHEVSSANALPANPSGSAVVAPIPVGDQNEDNSDVGYHSDQSVDKLGPRDLPQPSTSAQASSTPEEGPSIKSANPGVSNNVPSIRVLQSPTPVLKTTLRPGLLRNNPTYAWIEDAGSSTNSVNSNPVSSIPAVSNASSAKLMSESTLDSLYATLSGIAPLVQAQPTNVSFRNCFVPPRKMRDYVNAEVEVNTTEATLQEDLPGCSTGPPGPPQYVIRQVSASPTPRRRIVSETTANSPFGKYTAHDYLNTSESEMETRSIRSLPPEPFQKPPSCSSISGRSDSEITMQRPNAGSQPYRDAKLRATPPISRHQIPPSTSFPSPQINRHLNGGGLNQPLQESLPAPRDSCSRDPRVFGVLRVYAAYTTKLARGTSVRLQVTPRTCSREVVNLVINQLNKAAEQKKLVTGPLYPESEFEQFCLVAVIGSRERCLRDDFKPLDLQNPWSKGRLFVRRKDDLLAALEFGNSASV